MITKKLIYLASPFKDDDPKLSEKRFRQAAKASGIIMQKYDVYAYSPIVVGAPIAKFAKMHPYSELFYSMGAYMLTKCEELWILELEGWDKSVGVKNEIKMAKLYDLPIKMVTPRGRMFRYVEGI